MNKLFVSVCLHGHDYKPVDRKRFIL